MTVRELIIPPTMQRIVERAGYVPAVKVGSIVFAPDRSGGRLTSKSSPIPKRNSWRAGKICAWFWKRLGALLKMLSI